MNKNTFAYNDTIHNKRFNVELVKYFNGKTLVNSLKAFTDCLLKMNELYALSTGTYPETDDVWIDAMCYDFVKILSEWSGNVLDLSDESQKYMFDYLAMAELKAGMEERTLANLCIDWNNK